MVRSLEYGLYLLVFLLPWQTRFIYKLGWLNDGPWEYGTYSLYGTELLLWLLVLLALGWLLRRRRLAFSRQRMVEQLRQPAAQAYWLLVLSVLASGLTVLWALDWQLAYASWFRLLEGAALMALLVLVPWQLNRLAIAWVASAVVQSLFGAWQFLGQWTFASKWFGLAEHDSAIGGSIVLETAAERWLRAYGSLPHPNILAGFLLVAVLLLLYLAPQAKQIRHRWAVLLALVSLVPGMFYSFSRSGWLGLLAGLAILVSWLWRRRHEAWHRAWLLLGLLAVAVAGLAWPLPTLLSARLFPVERLEVSSIELRQTFTQQAVVIADHTWPWGVGIGNYTLGVHRFINQTWPFWYYQPVHNIYLLALVEIGLLPFILGAAGLLRLLQAARRYVPDLERATALSLLVGLLVVGLFDHFLWSLQFGVLLFWMIVGMNLRLQLRAG